MSSNRYHNLEYRAGVGMMIVNKRNQIFIGRRIDNQANGWQMPQGGIELGERPSSAALREMQEEIGTSKGRIIAETNNWYSYDIPTHLISRCWGGKYRGQRQKWFLINFEGSDDDINLRTAGYPEFSDWQWVAPTELLSCIVSFKFTLYSAVIKEFQHYLNAKTNPLS